MKIIIAPAKKMKVDRDTFPVQSQPQFLDQSKILQDFLKSRTLTQLQELWRCSDKTAQAASKFLNYSLTKRQTPALLAYQGIQYQYLAADVLDEDSLNYLQQNLYILSALYGLLRPFDGVVPYRLEMKTKMTGFIDYSLYHFWGDKVARALLAQDNLILNLASKEYSRMVRPFLRPDQKMVDVFFQEKKGDKWRVVGVHAKMARGEMVRFCAQRKIKDPAQLQDFNDFGYYFAAQASTSTQLYFRKKQVARNR